MTVNPETVSPGVEKPRAVCEITDEKAAEARLHESLAEVRPLRDFCTVPGVITYDTTRRLDLTAPVDFEVVRVLVEPGALVHPDQPLLILSSAEVGLARDMELQSEADLRIAAREHEWADKVSHNLQALLELLRGRPPLSTVEARFREQPLGEYREKILSAYSKLLLAESALSSTTTTPDMGGLSKRVVEERRSAREIASAQFDSASETSHFASIQAAAKAQAELRRAERLLQVNRDRLQALLGPLSKQPETDPNGKLSELVIAAPWAGHIQERHVLPSERVTAGTHLLSLADIRSVWISAEIHERNWRVLEFATGSDLPVQIPALQGSVVQAKVRYVGSRLSETTHSVPLIAELSNAEGNLKPGMFVWVDVPLSQEKQVLTVPASALMTHDNQQFVFQPEGHNRFRRVPVTPGLRTRQFVEIVAGLQAGQTVIDAGAFILKSELLLEREE